MHQGFLSAMYVGHVDRNSTLLDLLLANPEELLESITTYGGPGYSNHKAVDLKSLLSTLKTNSRSETPDFRNVNHNMLRSQ